MITTDDQRDLRTVVDAIVAFIVAKARTSVEEGLCVESKLDFETLESFFTASNAHFDRNEMVVFMNRSPAAIKLRNTTRGAELFVGFKYGFSFMDDGTSQKPLLMIGVASPEPGIERHSRYCQTPST